MKKNWLILVMMMLLLVGCSTSKDSLEAVDINDKEEIQYELKSGSTLTSVSKELEEMGYIHSASSMVKYAQENNKTNIKAGTYLISKSMTPVEMAEIFYKGQVYKGTKLVVQEGLEAVQIAEKVESLGLGKADRFMELVNNPSHFAANYEFLNDKKVISLEGYLYPLTYHFKEEDGEEVIIKTMLNSFNDVYQKNIQPKMDGTKSLHEIITLASIVEREAVLADEMPLVASVFQNRLDIDMKLQSCATVQYILKERKWILSNEEIAIDSPYNTYKYAGLPITPIASPSLVAIESVLEHPKTEYMYFLSKNDGTGSQVFAVTYEEHLKNKKKYLG